MAGDTWKGVMEGCWRGVLLAGAVALSTGRYTRLLLVIFIVKFGKTPPFISKED